MDKITKLPWYIQIEDKGLIRESDQSKLLFYNIKHAASDYDIKYITTIANPFSDNETDKANAEYICRAVNSHEGLREDIGTARMLLISLQDRMTFEEKKIYENFMIKTKERSK